MKAAPKKETVRRPLGGHSEKDRSGVTTASEARGQQSHGAPLRSMRLPELGDEPPAAFASGAFIFMACIFAISMVVLWVGR